MRARVSGSRKSRTTALATSSVSVASTTSPVTPSSMISAAAPAPPMHAFPARIASRNTRPKPSSRLGITKKAQSRYSASSA